MIYWTKVLPKEAIEKPIRPSGVLHLASMTHRVPEKASAVYDMKALGYVLVDWVWE